MAKVERIRRERFGTFQTELPGVQLRTEPGTKLDILRKTIERFYQLAKQFAEVKFQIDALTEEQTPWKEEIIGLAKEHEGLRGLTSEEDNFVLTVTPREKIIWNRELLKESMGIAYSTVTREDLVVNVSIPAGFITEKGITVSEEVVTKAMGEALRNLGISPEDSEKIMNLEIKVSVNEEQLDEMIERGQVQLLEGAKTSEISWVIRVDLLKKRRF